MLQFPDTHLPVMPKALTLLALMVAQVAGTAGGPVFLCIDHDGVVCIDGGPQFCHCCEQGGTNGAAVCDTTSAVCHDHEHETPFETAGMALKPGDCDCTHQLVSHDGVATVSRSTAWVVAQRAVVSDWTFAAPHALLVAIGGARSFAASPMGDALPLNLLSSVAMRC